jgi:hypothetical protein
MQPEACLQFLLGCAGASASPPTPSTSQSVLLCIIMLHITVSTVHLQLVVGLHGTAQRSCCCAGMLAGEAPAVWRGPVPRQCCSCPFARSSQPWQWQRQPLSAGILQQQRQQTAAAGGSSPAAQLSPQGHHAPPGAAAGQACRGERARGLLPLCRRPSLFLCITRCASMYLPAAPLACSNPSSVLLPCCTSRGVMSHRRGDSCQVAQHPCL